MTTDSSKLPATDINKALEAPKVEVKPAVKAPKKDITPVNAETTPAPSDEPLAAPAAVTKEVIETDVRAKLSKKSVDENPFIPSNPVALETAAKAVAESQGFDFNRGTSIGARLMARSRKMV